MEVCPRCQEKGSAKLQWCPTCSYPGTDTRDSNPKPESALVGVGYLCSAVAVIFFPIVFGPTAILCGLLALHKGDPRGVRAVVAGIAATILGVLLGLNVFRQSYGL